MIESGTNPSPSQDPGSGRDRAPNLRALPDIPAPRRVLFVETDWEMGMCRVARQLRDLGHQVRKVALHTSDLYYALWGIPVTPYRLPTEQFRGWLKAYTRLHAIDTYILYNNERDYNLIAEELGDELGINVVVMEMGLVRPLHVTAFSKDSYTPADIPALWDAVRSGTHDPVGFQSLPPQRHRVSTPLMVTRLSVSAAVSIMTRFLFPHFVDQQPLSARFHIAANLRGIWNYWRDNHNRSHLMSLVNGAWKRQYYFVPLQIPCDKQVVVQSPFDSMEGFLDTIADSFERCAPPDVRLIVKLHPFDRGYHDYTEAIGRLEERLGRGRIVFVDDLPLAPLIENSLGVITINSTVGLTALRHLAPVVALGKAIYDLPDLTFQGPLDEFWRSPGRPSHEVVETFVRLLESTIQGRGSLARKCFVDAGQSGIIWPKSVCEIFGFKQY